MRRDFKPPRVVPGEFFGYYLETDEYVVGGLGGGLQFDMQVPGSLVVGEDVPPIEDLPIFRYSIPVYKYRDEVRRAVQRVESMNIRVERVTILKGVVQAHPERPYHWRCPFCYPEEM